MKKLIYLFGWNKIYYFGLIAVVFFLMNTAPVRGAEFFFQTQSPEYSINELFEVGIFINTVNEEINAVAGQITFPQEFVEIININDGNSIINFWLEKPHFSERRISFSGIIPGGYSSPKGLVFSVTFLAKKAGVGPIAVDEIKVLRNDGLGTELKSNALVLPLSILGVTQDSIAPSNTSLGIIDDNLPEAFVPQVAVDESIFDGAWFVVFATQDKESGIDHYEVCEGKKKCVVASSPYLLQQQDLTVPIAVKAFDKYDNVRLVVVPPRNVQLWYQKYYLFVIIGIISAILFLLMRQFLWRR